MTNPYIAGPPARGKAFYGREAITDAILGSPYPALRVLGMRRIGKTSLLYHLAETSPALYLDFQAATGDPARLAGRMRQQLRRGRQRFPWLPAGDEGDGPIELLEKADGAAEGTGVTLLLLGDEAEGLAQFDDAFLKRLRGFIWGSATSRIVLTATKRLAKLDDRCHGWDTSSFLSGFLPPFYLARLTDEAAVALIRQSQSDTPLDVPDAVVAAILEHTGNHPYLIQWLCYQLWQKSSRPDRWVITPDDLTPVDDLARYFQMDFDYLSPGEQAILLAIAEGTAADAPSLSETAGLSAGDVSLFLHLLVHLGYLQERGGQLSLGTSFLGCWLQNNRARLKLHEAGTVSDRTEREAFSQEWIASLQRQLATYQRQERIASLRQQLATHIKNLNRLQEQAAIYGAGEVPLRLLNQIEAEEREIQRTEAELKRLNLYKEGSKDMSTDPALQQWAMSVLTGATTWLFTQAGEVLKERREKRQAKQKPAAPSAEPKPAKPSPITTADDFLTELRCKADLAACRTDVETVESLMQRLEDRTAKINGYREEEARGLGLDDRVLARQRIEAEQEQVAREAEEMRLILERLAGRPLQIPGVE